jgi:hypothetical protein
MYSVLHDETKSFSNRWFRNTHQLLNLSFPSGEITILLRRPGMIISARNDHLSQFKSDVTTSFWPPACYQLTFEWKDRKIIQKYSFFFSLPSLLSKVFNFLILTIMSDVFGLDCHERIGHSWIILGLNHSKYYFCQESTKFDRPKALIAHPMRFHSAVFHNERWLSGWFRGKSQATKWKSGIVWSHFQVYKIILIPHKQQAETDWRLPQ